ncbi:MAG: monovalent cation/H(+) antiporter subunit G [Firmicutes bacterium]|nr:monovalent cation/H(+) antiporter subunit G [Bacillota bacterium]
MNGIIDIISMIILIAGVVFMAFGVIAMFRFKNFYPRILTTSKIDTVGVITIIIGMAIRHGISSFTGKIVLLGVIMLIFNPLVAHILARSAYLCGYKIDESENGTAEVSK